MVSVTLVPPLAAQEGDPTVMRVQRLVNAGDRVAARRLADSLLTLADEGTPTYAAALYARALASSSAVEAERDYLRVSVEYSLTPLAEDATMMVAQLKLARTDRIGARRNFERLVREHPKGTQAAKAAFWAGRLALEDGDAARGCSMLGKAQAAVAPDDVEMSNQIAYYAQRCSASALAGSPPPASAETTATSPPAATRARPDSPRPVPLPRTPPPTPIPTVEPPPAASDSVRAAIPPSAGEIAPPKETEAPIDTAPPLLPPGKEYTVQVAAFPRLRDADALAQVLTQRGFVGRVWGSKPPFRVRVGRFASIEEAEAIQREMKAKRINGMVVEAEKP